MAWIAKKLNKQVINHALPNADACRDRVRLALALRGDKQNRGAAQPQPPLERRHRQSTTQPELAEARALATVEHYHRWFYIRFHCY
jgi:hypothetical protein